MSYLARKYAEEKHEGQRYGDQPYMTHIHDVVNTVESIWRVWGAALLSDYSLDTAIKVAYLHDTLEDTDATEQELRLKFGEEVLEAVKLLTKDESLSYDLNITRIVTSQNLYAIVVKIADNSSNLRADKSNMSEARRVRLYRQYNDSIKTLSRALVRAI